MLRLVRQAWPLSRTLSKQESDLRTLTIFAALGAAVFTHAARAEVLCTALADAATGQVLVQEGRCDQRTSPASTFKIPIALMGFDAGVLHDEHSPALPFREGYTDWNPVWRQTVDPQMWMRDSVVWYSQQVTQQLGAARFARYVQAFGYGNGDVRGDARKPDGLTQAWLGSSLQISPLEQLDFLGKLVRRALPVNQQAYQMTARITALGSLPGGWELHGKTGAWNWRPGDGAVGRFEAIGWFVGWATRADGRSVVFARLTREDREEKGSPGLRAREAMMRELPQRLQEL